MAEKKVKPAVEPKKTETPTDVVKALQSGNDEGLQGITQLMQRIVKAQNNLEVANTAENPVKKIRGGKGQKGKTGPKNPAGRESNES